jgi:rSAM/selenodomain-associated transferase 2
MISVIIPTLNAAPSLARTLAPLVGAAALGLVKQVIVADGGSKDETIAIAEAAGCEVVVCARGRGPQMRAGAAAAKADWLLFLHADTVPGDAWIEEISRFIGGSDQRAAAFTLAFDDDSAGARWVAFWAGVRARLLKLPYGDQGLLVSRALYNAVDGYRDLPLMEDVDMVRRIGAERLYMLRSRAVTSADKYRRDGYWRRSSRNIVLLTRYLLGADPAELAKKYV